MFPKTDSSGQKFLRQMICVTKSKSGKISLVNDHLNKIDFLPSFLSREIPEVHNVFSYKTYPSSPFFLSTPNSFMLHSIYSFNSHFHPMTWVTFIIPKLMNREVFNSLFNVTKLVGDRVWIHNHTV